ncbi:MAG TPA: hypothetical protein PLU73_05490 [Bacteroidia bacterium]|nr:hypothetical protein [Bacteroidia bacterium]
MSRINLDNYEAFLLDHMEGKLNVQDLAELKAFSLLHPELNIDLEQDSLPYLSKETENIDFDSDLLKKEEMQDEELISYLEGTLSLDKKVLFELKLEKDKELQKLLHSYQRTKLKADTELVYEDKELLFAASDAALVADPLLNYFEGQLMGENKLAFEKDLKDSKSLTDSYNVLSKTKVLADLSLVYPNKEALKKEAVVIVFFSTRRLVSMAAAILLIFGLIVLFNLLNSDPKQNKEVLAKKSTSEVKENVVSSSAITNIPKEEHSTEKINGSNPIPEKQFASVKKENSTLVSDTISSNAVENKLLAESKKEEVLVPREVKKDSIALAFVKKEESKFNNAPDYKKNVLLAYENEEEEINVEQKDKPGFWKRAARFANQANKLGMKAVNGEENKGDGFLLSFNSLSIEKK